MNFQDLRKKLKNPNQELLFRELFADYKKFQIKKMRSNKFDTDSKDYTQSEKTLSAVKLDNIIKKQSQKETQQSNQVTSKFKIKKKLRAKQNRSVEKTFSYFFRNEGRDQQCKKKCFFKDHFINDNTLISESLKMNYGLIKEKSLGFLNSITNMQKVNDPNWKMSKQNIANWKLKYSKYSNSTLQPNCAQDKLQKTEYILKQKYAKLQQNQDLSKQNQLFRLRKSHQKINETHSHIFPITSE